MQFEKRLIASLLMLMFASQIQASQVTGVNVSTRSSGTGISVIVSNDKAVLTVSSQKGIGQATMTRSGEAWPKEVVVRLKLSGLESLKLTADKTTLSWSVSSHDDHPTTMTVLCNGEEKVLEKDDPLFSSVTHPHADEASPKAEGYFEVKIPQSVLRPELKEIRLEWIDFFR